MDTEAHNSWSLAVVFIVLIVSIASCTAIVDGPSRCPAAKAEVSQ